MSLLAAAACGGSSDGDDDPPPSSPPPAGSGDTVTGRERFGWTLTESGTDASRLQFAVYVDGDRRVLEGVSCTSGPVMECSAPLPSMSAGRHTLELAAFLMDGTNPVEGPRSAPLQLVVASLTASSGSSAVDGRSPAVGGLVVASDDSELTAEILASELVDPVDLAVDPSGRTLVVERTGRIRVLDRDGSSSDGDRIDDLPPSRDQGAVVLSMALAPDFTESRHVYVLKAEPGADESRALIVRYRETDGRFVQAAVVASIGTPGPDPTGVIRFGPDGAIYLGLGTRSSGADGQPASDAAGRILRLLPDGRTPRDNPRSSTVYSSGHRDPAGFVWHHERHTFWEVESGVEADEVNTIRADTDYGWPAASGSQRLTGSASPSVLLPAGTLPSGMTAITDPQSPLYGDLIVSSVGHEDLLKIKMTPEGEPVAGKGVRLLGGRFGAVGQVTAGPDGALYFITRNRDSWGAGLDVLVRLTPAAK